MRTMIVAAALILSTSLAFAGENCRTLEKSSRNLTTEQKAKVREMRRSFHQETAALTAAHRETLKKYAEACRAGDTVAAASYEPLLASYREEMRLRRAELDARIATVVTPERQQQ